MNNRIFTISALACALLLAGVSSLTAGLTGAIFTTNMFGTVVNGNQYDSPCSVYLNGGPGPHAPAHAAGLLDGDYFFQVTDPSGKTLLSTDPVSNRRFTVSGGVITLYTGTGGPAHMTNPNLNDQPLGITIALANMSCPADFLATSNNGGAYKGWVTPASSLIGNPANVDNPCGTGCFHGFVPSASKTDNFKVNAAATFCLTVQKQFHQLDGTITVGANWEFDVIDPQGVTNSFFTDLTGTLSVCGLTAGAYTVSESITSVIGSLIVNGTAVSPSTIFSFTWFAGQQGPVILFINLVVTPG